MIFLRRLLLLGALLAMAACATAPLVPSARSTAPATRTILISIDGFRADYLDRGATPVLSALAADGARAAMRPSFPSKTFPNHYAIITGRVPDHNGIVNNTMEDPALPGVTFRLSDTAVASNPVWWEGARPLWVSAQEQGIATATLFWPGSDYAIFGVRPTHFLTFDQKLPDFARVDHLLGWLDQPEGDRIGFMTLYFDIVDTAGHIYGPDSPKTISATAQVDAAIGRLLDGLEARGLLDTTNLVIVADHGMGAISDDRIMSLDARISPDAVRVAWTGAFAGLTPLPGHEAEVEAALIGRVGHGECWRKADIPARLSYGSHPRVPAIICLADPGWRYESESQKAWRGGAGDHGWDPADPDMASIFIAHGPAFRRGVTLAPFDNVSVYPLLAKLTGVTPEPGDGRLEDTAAALR